MNLQKIGENIKKAREKSGMTQVEVATEVGIHPNFFARVERGEEAISLETLEKIVNVLNIKSSDILPF